MVGSIIGLIIVGAIIGALARLVVPGRQHIGIVLTILLGIVGAVVGGLIGSAIGGQVVAWIVGIVVAAVLVFLIAGGSRRTTV